MGARKGRGPGPAAGPSPPPPPAPPPPPRGTRPPPAPASAAAGDGALAGRAGRGFRRGAARGGRLARARHEAVATVADPGAPAGTVVRVVRPGYGDGEHQLRPAAVVVAAPPTPPTGSD